MRLKQFYTPILLEMNVANLDQIKKDISDIFDVESGARHQPVPKGTRDLFLKRCLKSMANDEAGHMVFAHPLEKLPNNAPDWMTKAFQAGQPIMQLGLKQTFVDKLPHIIDWLITDPRGIEAVRTAPEATFLDALYANADAFFKQVNGKFRDTAPIADEPGREIVMTFRSLDGKPPQAFLDKSLAPNEHGRVVMFWCKLVSANAMEREGKLMGHCVGNGSYAQAVAQDRTTIYSLRDAENQPGVTVEVNVNGNGMTLNQVKGKGNKPPTAKYAPFVKDFLNALNVTVTHHGVNDVRGLGLFTHNGKFGSIDEVGAPISTTFPNGDTLRADTEGPKKGAHYNPGDTLKVFYVEKGAIPFTIELKGTADGSGKIANAKITDLTILRDEPARYGVWSKNISSYLTENGIEPNTRDLEQIGIYFNAETKQYGSLDDISTKLYDKGDVSARGMEIIAPKRNTWDKEVRDYETIFTVKGIHIFTLHSAKTPNRAGWKPTRIKIEKPTIKMASILTDFLNEVKAPYPDRDDERDILRRCGATFVRDRWVSAAEGKKAFENKRGAVTIFGAYVYVTDKSGDLLMSQRTTTADVGPNREFHKSEPFASSEYEKVLSILADWSATDPAYEFSGFGGRDELEAGYTERNGKIIPIDSLFKKIIIAGERVEIDVQTRGEIAYKLTKGGETLSVTIDEQNRVIRINKAAGLNQYLPVLLKAIKAKVRTSRFLSLGLKLQNGKAVALDPVKDADLLGFLEGDMNLPGGFRWVSTSHNGYSRDRAPSIGGYIRTQGKERWDGEVVAEIDTGRDNNDSDYYHDPAYKLRRRLPEDISREEVMKAIVNLMRFYHSKVEQYEVGEKEFYQF